MSQTYLRRASSTTAGLLLALTVVCGDGDTEGASTVRAVEGSVKLAAGQPRPALRRVENTTDPEICGRDHSLEDVALSASGGIGHAIVWLTPAGEPAPRTAAPPDPVPVILDNLDCRFVPHSSVLTVGQTLVVRNGDPTLHTVHLYGPREENIALPFQEMSVERSFDTPGLYQVKCDVHGWMQAFIRVGTDALQTVTDAEGAFRIAEVPAGSYLLEVWHERLGSARLPIEVPEQGLSGIQISLPASEAETAGTKE